MRKSRLSDYKQKHLTYYFRISIELFVAGTTARIAASLVGVNKTTASYYFLRLRQIIYDNSQEHDVFSGKIEFDESYFGGVSVVEVLPVKCLYSAY